MKGLKKPWIAAVLALALGGPGCFYLGWRRGAKATLAWLFVVSFLLATTLGQIRFLQGVALEPSILFLTLLQAALAWFAYRSCKRTNAEAAKAADRAESGATQRVQADCFKEIKNVGLQVIVLSALSCSQV